MESEVVLKRELLGDVVKQKSKSEYFSATDLFRVGNKWRVSNGMQSLTVDDWKKNKSSKDFMEALKISEQKEVYIAGRGRGHDTWVHPYIFIDMALWLNPTLKIEVYKWLFDSLVRYRNYSGDSYKKMCGALYLTETNKSQFRDNISSLANRIKVECGVDDWNSASEGQLKLRDKIHDNIALLSDILKDRETLYNVSIKKAKDDFASREDNK